MASPYTHFCGLISPCLSHLQLLRGASGGVGGSGYMSDVGVPEVVCKSRRIPYLPISGTSTCRSTMGANCSEVRLESSNS